MIFAALRILVLGVLMLRILVLRILVLGVLMLRILVLRVPVYPSLEGEKEKKRRKAGRGAADFSRGV